MCGVGAEVMVGEVFQRLSEGRGWQWHWAIIWALFLARPNT